MVFEKYLLIVMDSVRYDSFIGAKTPNIDRLGVPFKAYSRSDNTLGSASVILSSFSLPKIPGKDVLFLDENKTDCISFIKKNYKLILASGSPFFFQYPGNPLNSVLSHYKLIRPGLNNTNFFFSSNFLIKNLMEEISGLDKFIAVLWCIETHSPYFTPEKKKNGWSKEYAELEKICKQGKTPNPNLVKTLHSSQMQAIEYIDHLCGPLFDSLSNCRIIVTADHGDAFGENGAFGHGFGFSETQFCVPLLIGEK